MKRGGENVKLHEILWVVGFFVSLFGGCCLDSPGQAYLAAVAIVLAGLAIMGAGFLAKKMSVKP